MTTFLPCIAFSAMLVGSACFCGLSDAEETNTTAAPVFTDPNYHGSCDPKVVWNEHLKEWWVFYTARRATHATSTYVGTPIGVVASSDLVRWRFVGYFSLDGVAGETENFVLTDYRATDRGRTTCV